MGLGQAMSWGSNMMAPIEVRDEAMMKEGGHEYRKMGSPITCEAIRENPKAEEE